MAITRYRIDQILLLHYHKRNAVREAPILVRTRLIRRSRLMVQADAWECHRDNDHDRLTNQGALR